MRQGMTTKLYNSDVIVDNLCSLYTHILVDIFFFTQKKKKENRFLIVLFRICGFLISFKAEFNEKNDKVFT